MTDNKTRQNQENRPDNNITNDFTPDSNSDFNSDFASDLLSNDPGADFDGDFAGVPNDAKGTLIRLWHSVSDQHRRLAIVAVSVICYTILSIAAPYYSISVIDLLWENIKSSQAIGEAFKVTWQQGGPEIMYLLAMYLGAALFSTLHSLLMASFAEKLSLRLRTELAAKLNRLPLSYFDQRRTGAILSRFTNDLDKLSEALQTGTLKLITSTGLIIGSLLMMLHLNLRLTLIFLLFMALAMGFTKIFAAYTLKCAAARQNALSDLTGLVEEAYTGRIVIRAFGRETSSSTQMHQAAENLAKTSCQADFIINAINPAIRMVNRIGQAGIVLYASHLLLKGRISVGVFQAFFQYVNQSAEPLTEASFMINSLQSALASAERIYETLDEVEIIPDTPTPAKITATGGQVEFRGQVEFHNVKFGYTPDKTLMHGINFTAHPGQKIAIVGTTGAGKTTLINLLMRFYEVNDGAILLDGRNITDLTRSDLRRCFGMVLQDTWLFSGTIAENIAYGRPDATREEIIAAAQAAHVDFFVRTLPDGYDTVISSESESLSAGQKQLLTIARVFLCNPPVLILDEATSSVDTRTEFAINRAMHTLMQERTSFVIAHRLSTIVDADLILLMQNGSIVEQGTHAELLAAGGAYASLYNSQFAN